MTELQQELDELEDKRKGIISRLKVRLRELNAERAEVLTKIEKLEGRESKPAKRKSSSRSPLGHTIYQIVAEAGDEGLNSGEVVEELQQENPKIERGTVLTHLSRLKKRGALTVTGVTGFFRYVATDNNPAGA